MSGNETTAGVRTDAHIHLFEHGFDGENPNELAQYQRIRHSAGIAAALVVGYEGSPQFRGNNEYVLGLSRTHEWIHPTRFIDVTAAPSSAVLRDATHGGYDGLSLYLPEDADVFGSWSAQQLEALGNAPLLSVNAGQRALTWAAQAFERLGETTILLSHLGSPGEAAASWSRADAESALSPLLALSQLPNVIVKVSGMYAIDPAYPHLGAENVFRTILDTFGPARLVWGSDYAPATHSVSDSEMMRIPEWLDDMLEAEDRAAVLGRTLAAHLRQARSKREEG